MGKRKLEAAIISTRDQYDVEVHWKPFLLRPAMPLEGKDKGPGPHAGARLKEVGKAVGIDFTGLTQRYPNTVQAHELLSLALESYGHQVQDTLSEILFRSYFTDGVYPGGDNLVAIGVEAGMKKEDCEQLLASGARADRIQAEDRAVKKKGVHGVPYFFFNGQDYGLSGAQAPETFVKAFGAATSQ